jgi:L-ascorbate metabolism protein UlaG (beta-lactamase superfamily)
MTISIKYLAHAGFQIKTKNTTIYVDLEQYGKFSEKADVILVTHSHTDHCDPSQIEKARKPNAIIIAPSDCSSKIKEEIKTLKAGEEMTVGDVRIKAVEAYNFKRFRSPGNPFHPKGFGVGYLITSEGKTIYHAGDTDFTPEMKKLGHVDVALLPSGGTYTMDNADAVDASLAINPSVVIPMHRWDTNPEEFKKKVEANSKIKVVLLKENEAFKVI